MPHTLIFDIGKTNKKCFILDEQYQEVWKEYIQIAEIKDEDGFPCDDLETIQKWIKKTTKKVLKKSTYQIQRINFSTYGASLVHLDKHGEPVGPLYNYLKPYPKKVAQSFYKKYGLAESIGQETASPSLGMLNSGLQLYWLKKTRPKLFAKIRWSLHLPQYLSYLFTKIPLSDYTSIGCHTCLWNYKDHRYHDWVYAEGLHHKLAPIAATDTSINVKIAGKKVAVGIGIHDSSAALLPYLWAGQQPFLLLSTGTWNIALNPFSRQLLSKKDLKNDCLNFLRIDGQAVRASRLFLGNEYKIQTTQIADHFKVKLSVFKKIKFNVQLYAQLIKRKKNYFAFKSLPIRQKQPPKNDLAAFTNYEVAYHQLMLELVQAQIVAAERAIKKNKIKKIYIDGGGAKNDLFVKLLLLHFRGIKIQTSKAPLGSALGAALVVNNKKIKGKFLKKQYALKKHSL